MIIKLTKERDFFHLEDSIFLYDSSKKENDGAEQKPAFPMSLCLYTL